MIDRAEPIDVTASSIRVDSILGAEYRRSKLAVVDDAVDGIMSEYGRSVDEVRRQNEQEIWLAGPVRKLRGKKRAAATPTTETRVSVKRRWTR